MSIRQLKSAILHDDYEDIEEIISTMRGDEEGLNSIHNTLIGLGWHEQAELLFDLINNCKAA